MNFAYLAAAAGGSNSSMLIMMVIMVGALYFFMILPQKKKEKDATARRNSIEIGDEVTTIGGIVGRVVNIKEDTFVLETAGERSKVRFKRWAIQEVGKLSLDASGEVVVKPTENKESAGFFGFGKKKNKPEE